MGTYLFLRGNRNKKLFIDVASELEKKGHECFLIKFELGELLFPSKNHSIFAPSHLTEKEYDISDEELLKMQIYNVTFKKEILNKETLPSELKIYKQYMYFIDQFIEQNNIDIICLFNGYHWIDQISKHIAKKRGLKVFHFEDGLFRPYTVTCDTNGINAEASVPKDPGFYDSIEMKEERLEKYLFEPEDERLKQVGKEKLMKVALVKAFSMIGNLFRIHPNFYAHITLWQAIKYFFLKKYFSLRKDDAIQLPEEYIFLPFQVARDTQILYNSKHIKTMPELLDLVYDAITLYNEKYTKKLKIVVKEHPEDLSRNNYRALKKKYKNNKNVIFIKKFNIGQLISNALAVITINSTVGIEALTMGKRVITLGEANYNIDGVVFHCDHPKNLQEVIETALNNNVNKLRIKKFLYYLRFTYQIEGTITNPNSITSKNIAERISTS